MPTSRPGPGKTTRWTFLLLLATLLAVPTAACAGDLDTIWVGEWTADSVEAYQTSAYRWPGAEPVITYSYANLVDGGLGLPAGDLKAAVEEALNLWAAYAPLHFVEVVDSGPLPSDTSYSATGSPDIRFGHHYIDGASGSNVLAHAYYPTGSGLGGDVHYDNANTWRIGAGTGYSFLEVTVHELGHCLGLGHEPLPADGGNEAIMNPKYVGRYYDLGTAHLRPDDIDGIRAIYGAGTGSVTPLPEPATIGLLAIGGVLILRRRREAA